MLSPMAKNDIQRLRENGCEITDEEVIALNDLALEIENGKDTTAVNHPRFAFAGNVVLHEPTVGALEWWWSYGIDAAWTPKGKLHTYYFMLAFSRDVELLSALKRPRDINKAVKAWLKGVSATDGELFRALMYVKHGVKGTPESPEENESQSQKDSLDVLSQLLVMCSGQTGISPDSLKTKTKTELMHLIRFSSRAGLAIKPSIARQYIRYQQIVREIESRGGENG